MLPFSVTQQQQRSEHLFDAYFLLALAISTSPSYHPATLGVALLGFVTLLLGLLGRVPELLLRWHWRPLSLISLVLIATICAPADTPERWYRYSHQAMVGIGFVLVTLFYAGSAQRQRRILWAVGAMKLALLLIGIWLVQQPTIDVWHLQHQAVQLLLHGKNPYSTPVADIYTGGFAYGHQKYYAYAPLNLILSLPAEVLLGDYRYGLVAALAASVLLFRETGRRLGVSVARIDFLTLALLLHPRLERLMIYGWLEPYLVLLLSLFVFLQVSGRTGILPTVVLFAMPLLKQYFAAPLLLYLLLLRPPLRTVLWASLLGLLALSPLLLWNFQAVVRNGLLFFVQNLGFRSDSISVAAAIFELTGYQSGVKTTFVFQLGLGLLSAWLLRRQTNRLASFLCACAVSLFGSFLVAPQAFINYYFFVGTLLAWATLLLTPAQSQCPDPPSVSLLHSALRSLAVLSLTCAITGFAFALYYHFLCPRTATVGSARLAKGEPLLSESWLLARSTEQLFVCHDRHCFGPLCHDDLRCLCVDHKLATTPEQVQQRLYNQGRQPASCVLDHAHPLPSDRTGQCWNGRCVDRLE